MARLQTIFYHIVQAPVPYLKHSGLKLAPVFAALAENTERQSVFARFRRIQPREIDAAHAYLTRFGTDVTHPAPVPADTANGIVLDECYPL